MKALTCEMCQSNDLIKQDGVFVCQHCGTKYSVEDAKNMMNTVKVDKTDEMENILALARRAKQDDNSVNAEKYYGMYLECNPNNWEAAFFHVYFQAKQCSIAGISSAALSVKNITSRAVELAKLANDDSVKTDALLNLSLYTSLIANLLSSAATNHYNQFMNVDNASSEWMTRIVNISYIYESLEAAVKKHFPKETESIATIQKLYNKYISDYCGCFNKQYVIALNTRLNEEITAYDPSYDAPIVRSVSLSERIGVEGMVVCSITFIIFFFFMPKWLNFGDLETSMLIWRICSIFPAIPVLIFAFDKIKNLIKK